MSEKENQAELDEDVTSAEQQADEVQDGEAGDEDLQ